MYVREQTSMITNDQTTARWSLTGHYNFHYPNLDGEEIVIPAESHLEGLSWAAHLGWQAFKWNRSSGPVVVWLEMSKIK